PRSRRSRVDPPQPLAIPRAHCRALPHVLVSRRRWITLVRALYRIRDHRCHHRLGPSRQAAAGDHPFLRKRAVGLSAPLLRRALRPALPHSIPVDPVTRRRILPRAYHPVLQTSAPAIGCEASASLAGLTACFASIHFGAASRSSSGRFIVNAAT